MPEETVKYETKGKLSIITLNNPNALNSLTIPQFTKLSQYIKLANEDPDTLITLIQSTGKFFSAGANIKSITKLKDRTDDYYLSEITSKNMYLVHLFTSHKKILALGLNGPVIGLTASLVCLCDLVYCINPNDVYMSFPFSNIGLVNECGVSGSLSRRIGLSKALEHVVFAKSIKGSELYRLGLINECYEFKKGETEEFNRFLQKKLIGELDGLDGEIVLENKKLIKKEFNDSVRGQILEESMKGLGCWVENRPQDAFAEIIKGTRKHKL